VGRSPDEGQAGARGVKTIGLEMSGSSCHMYVYHCYYHIKVRRIARYCGVTPIILATQEAEIRRIVVRSQPGANSSQDPISKKPNTKRTGRVAQGVGPEFKPQYCQKKKTV
jgi:hypothetical protein